MQVVMLSFCFEMYFENVKSNKTYLHVFEQRTKVYLKKKKKHCPAELIFFSFTSFVDLINSQS